MTVLLGGLKASRCESRGSQVMGSHVGDEAIGQACSMCVTVVQANGYQGAVVEDRCPSQSPGEMGEG